MKSFGSRGSPNSQINLHHTRYGSTSCTVKLNPVPNDCCGRPFPMQRIFLSSPADWRLGPSAYRYTIIGPDPLTTLLLASALRPARTDPERPDSDQLDGRLSRAMFPPPQLRANWNPPGVDYVTVMTVAVASLPLWASSSVVPRPLRA
ncbi:hypothetical protein BO86DRAFT_144714 [Aspergillus japonicus CBS 114.51]|uniref:Uncharacterized protein n=1 Tax=Aspergillus japonicus CBS 114.51 TaxID=1448312 RepID=A0A8T8WVB7_ASPJA|nr:hypothetical protein BO86DRAFT_144714 [Aspergillus japonicus CBS 114.51]RAH79807.1 hypothetical protein BO86DRAFT_144714 [Aspergillus japonicus CBS 114.51]